MDLAAEVCDEYANGTWKYQAIADKFGISRKLVGEILHKAGYRKSGIKSCEAYEMHDRYFRRLGPKEAYTLGILFAFGKNDLYTQMLTVTVPMNKKEVMDHVVEELGIFPKSIVRKFVRVMQVRVRSVGLSDDLAELGLGEEPMLPEDELGGGEVWAEFMKGFFWAKSRA